MKHETDDDLKALRQAQDAAAKLTTTEQRWRAEHAALLKQRTETDEAYRSLDEILADKDRLVDEAAARWAEKCGGLLVDHINGETEVVAGSARTIKRAPALPYFGYSLGLGGDRGLTLEDLCGLVPDLMKARLAGVIRNSGRQFGLPASERKAKLAELDAQIAALEERHTTLVDGAAQVGITLPLLDTVRQRREDDARKQARERELAAERARGVYVVSGMPR